MIHITLFQKLDWTAFLSGLRNIIRWEFSGEESAACIGGVGDTRLSWALFPAPSRVGWRTRATEADKERLQVSLHELTDLFQDDPLLWVVEKVMDR